MLLRKPRHQARVRWLAATSTTSVSEVLYISKAHTVTRMNVMGKESILYFPYVENSCYQGVTTRPIPCPTHWESECCTYVACVLSTTRISVTRNINDSFGAISGCASFVIDLAFLFTLVSCVCQTTCWGLVEKSCESHGLDTVCISPIHSS